jgi:SAM-dependent methyltransferase
MSLPRAAGGELMDLPDAGRGDMAHALDDLRAVNRFLGGTRIVLHHLSKLFASHPQASYRILDVATGAADIPLAVARWARERGTAVEIVATDNHPTTLELAREAVRGEPSIGVETADALRLPYADASFDVALCSTALHHFDDDEDAVCVLRELDRVSRIGFVVNDLARSRTALLGARLLAITVWRRHRLTRHDGPLSVRRALTAPEMRRLAERAGLADATVRGHFPFRLALVVDKREMRTT